MEFVRLDKEHLDSLLACSKLRICKGALEGMNKNINLLSHRYWGFRNPKNFISAIYHCCADLPLIS